MSNSYKNRASTQGTTYDRSTKKLSKSEAKQRANWSPRIVPGYEEIFDADPEYCVNWRLEKTKKCLDNQLELSSWENSGNSKMSQIVTKYYHDKKTSMWYVCTNKKKWRIPFDHKYFNENFAVQKDEEVVNLIQETLENILEN